MKNIFVKSMLRQPVRTALLMLLISLAAGAFIMRAAEFQIIRAALRELGGRYVAVGFIRPAARGNLFVDVGDAADIISGSEFVRLEDRRRTVEGVMHGIYNLDIMGGSLGTIRHGRSPYAFFYGELIEIRETVGTNVRLYVLVEEVLAGYPEHVVAGQIAVMRFNATERNTAQGNPLDTFREGERYLFRAFYRFAETIPRVGNDEDLLDLRPLNHRHAMELDPPGQDFLLSTDVFGTVFEMMDLPENPVWYIHAPPGVSVDYMEIDWLAREILFLRHTHAGLNLRTTVDMAYIPHMRPPFDAITLMQGRLINYEDNYLQNHVIVIHECFATRRGLELGDTITVSIPYRQVKWCTAFYNSAGLIDGERQTAWQPSLGSKPSEFTQTPELEIVGTFRHTTGARHQLWESVFAYIPDTILTHDYMITPWIWSAPPLPDPWYSFVLHDAEDRTAFLSRYAELLLQMGYILTVPETGAENFHATAAPVTQTITFNLVLFGAVTLLVFALVAWLFLRQRRKDFAVLRALGCPAKKAFWKLAGALTVFAVPSVAIGGVAAWVLARGQIESTLHPFEEIVYGFEPAAPENYFLLIFAAIAFLGLFVLFVIFSRIFRKPVLELLQK